jgi:hypothetical protein
MSFLERAKQAAEQARQAAVDTTNRATVAMHDPATAEKARSTFKLAKRGLATAVERIDPGVLADVIIKATALQEKANRSLRDKGSPYRISEIGIGAAIPPSVTFSIARLDDPEADPAIVETSSAMVAAGVAGGASDGPTITTLDGTELDESDLETIAEG